MEQFRPGCPPFLGRENMILSWIDSNNDLITMPTLSQATKALVDAICPDSKLLLCLREQKFKLSNLISSSICAAIVF